MRALSAVLILAAATLPAAGAPTREQAQQLVNRIQQKVKENQERLPNYICRQTVERSQHKDKKKPQQLDTLRMDVALINGRELYSWPGAAKFGDESITGLVKSGAIGTGAYASHPQSLFLRRGARFNYIGDEMMDGRKTCRLDFSVAREVSAFRLSDGRLETVVAYHGTVWADAETFELVRLDTFADQIPADLRVTTSQDSVHYQSVPIGGQRCTLPSTVELEMTTRDVTFHNLTKFEGCRQYVGESTIHFNDSEVSAAAAAEVKPLELPAKLRVEMRLETPIRSDSRQAVGDEVTATLSAPIRQDDKVLIPAGARCTGRITRLGPKKTTSRDYWLVGIAIDTIEDKQVKAPFRGTLVDAGITASGAYFLPFFTSPGVRVPGGWYGTMLQLDPPANNEGVFLVRGGKLTMSKGVRLVWETK